MEKYNLQNPFLALLKKRILLSKEGASKSTYQLILDIKNANFFFRPGDSIGIIPMNDPALVEKTIVVMGGKKEQKVESKDGVYLTLFEFLTYKASITHLSPTILRLIAQKKPSQYLQDLLQIENKALRTEYLQKHELWDLLKEHKEAKLSIAEICSHLLPIMPRFYSISSAQNFYPNELHLTVTSVTYEVDQKVRHGVTSHLLCDLAIEGETLLPIYLNPSHGFTLPDQKSSDIIMIAAGTGVAPFLSFMQERLLQKATGKNWLFFGECYRKGDFYYEDFWTSLEKKNLLKLDLAFSRDQKEKIYVQQRLQEKSQELWQWLQKGAIIYVCGNAGKLGRDVQETLLKIFEQEGKMNPHDALSFLKELKLQKRYLREVY